MGIDYRQLAIPKPEPRKTAKARAERAQAKADKQVYASVTARDGERCRVCGMTGPELHRHHLRGRTYTTKEDVCLLCEECHGGTHVRVGGKWLDLRGNADRQGGLIVRMRLGGEWKVIGRV
jgi:hypothetical protein